MESLQSILFFDFLTESGKTVDIKLSYQTFGQAYNEAPVVLINHALTGNSNVTGSHGWWSEFVGINKCIDTRYFAVLAFNIPGNGFYDAENLIDDYHNFTARDIARIFYLGLDKLGITSLYATIGGSVGGGIGWEMVALYPNLIEHFIPVATDWKSTDWMIANCYLQERILNNSSNPIEDARIQAMLCYRTPQSLQAKFNRSINESLDVFNVESWLSHHGDKLKNRFQLKAYKLMNHLLKTIDITRGKSGFDDVVSRINSHIHIVSIRSDIFFMPNENKETFDKLNDLGVTASYYEIDSDDGHDAFLIEFDQLTNLLNDVFDVQFLVEKKELRKSG